MQAHAQVADREGVPALRLTVLCALLAFAQGMVFMYTVNVRTAWICAAQTCLSLKRPLQCVKARPRSHMIFPDC